MARQKFVLFMACGLSVVMTACGGGGSSTTTPPPPLATYVLTVNSVSPASGVAIVVTPADNNAASNGTTSFSRTYNAGVSVTLKAPDPSASGGNAFKSWTGCASAITVTCTVTMNANTTVTPQYAVPTTTTPVVTVTPSLLSINSTQALTVTVAVSGGSGNPTPGGTVKVTSGSYGSSVATLSSGSAIIPIPAGSLAAGSDVLTATYTPDLASAATYNTATGTSAAITVSAVSTASSVTVDQSTPGPAVTDQLLGMNMAYWYDQSTPAIVPAFQTAGIKTVRWPGGSGSDNYHWKTNSLCGGGYTYPSAAFDTFIADVIQPGNFDLALTANYGNNEACTGPGDPAEAAAWIQNAKINGNYVSRITVGNEEYGSWETDLHAAKNDAATYATAAATGYYPAIKAANPNVLVGVSVNPGNSPPWDTIVLSKAKYDFVEYHFYPQGPGGANDAPNGENDTFLVQQAAQRLTDDIKTIQAELATAGRASTPIYVGEIGSVYTNPGVQTSSITQALYAGQVLGEMMNNGISRASWWIGFGGCSNTNSYSLLFDGTKQYADFSPKLYGWQTYGGYMVFSDGLPEYGCNDSTIPTLAAGTLLPTARAFQLFSKVAVNGENVLTANVAGDTTDVRAYAATSQGGTALVLFNLNQNATDQAVVTLSKQTSTTDVTIETYSKGIYDQSKNGVWAPPTVTDLGAISFPLTLSLDPWSMNVVIIK